MNDALIQKLATEIANATLREQWRFYFAVIAISFLGAVAGSYIRSRFAKHGEVAATKADANEIIKHLEKTTNATKAIELSLAHGDWIKRESNTLKRAKLEQLILAGYAIAANISNAGTELFGEEYSKDGAPVDEFQMLSQLYFFELREHTHKVIQSYREARIAFSPIRQTVLALRAALSIATSQGNADSIRGLLEDIKNLMNEHNSLIANKAFIVHKAAHELATEGYALMTQLTVPHQSSE